MSVARTLLIASFIFVACFIARPAHADPPESFYNSYAKTLSSYVNVRGAVNYAELKEHCRELRSFLLEAEHQSREEFVKWTEPTQLAFWINVYNALVLVTIVDHYPIEGGFFDWLFSPSNSIQEIPGAFDKSMFTVMGQRWTLLQIKEEVLRKQFHEPRLLFALTDGAKGSPPLRREPYEGGKLSIQLDEQARAFLAIPENYQLDRQRKRVIVSELFDWLGDDFVASYGSTLKDGPREVKERAVANFLSQFAIESEKKVLGDPELKVDYTDFNWSLNDAEK